MRSLENKAPQLIVPLDAVDTTPEGDYFVLRFTPAGADSGTLEQVPVTVKANQNGQLLITSGLEAGDEIASAGLTQLSDGQPVRRFRGIDQ
jgi:multidrug efflux pump subunit AcrA (membrane-fusion protein)